MSKKNRKVCTRLNYIEHSFILASTITGYISLAVFASLLCIPIGNTSSAIGLKVSAVGAGIKKYKSTIKKNKKRMIK